MKTVDPIRAWKDPVYRAGLSAEEQAQLPGHPSGILNLDEEQLKLAAGGAIPRTTYRTCTEYTSRTGCC
jgi:mersacidin/lichenicidin family type 2 lantibiotic